MNFCIFLVKHMKQRWCMILFCKKTYLFESAMNHETFIGKHFLCRGVTFQRRSLNKNWAHQCHRVSSMNANLSWTNKNEFKQKNKKLIKKTKATTNNNHVELQLKKMGVLVDQPRRCGHSPGLEAFRDYGRRRQRRDQCRWVRVGPTVFFGGGSSGEQFFRSNF